MWDPLAYYKSLRRGNSYLAVEIDPTHKTLLMSFYLNGHLTGQPQTSSLPSSFDPTDWSHLAIDENLSQPGRPVFQVTLSDRNRDPLVEQQGVLLAIFSVL